MAAKNTLKATKTIKPATATVALATARKVVAAPSFDPSRMVVSAPKGRVPLDPKTYALTADFRPFGDGKAKTVSTVKQTLPTLKKKFAAAGVAVEFAVTETDEPGYQAIYIRQA